MSKSGVSNKKDSGKEMQQVVIEERKEMSALETEVRNNLAAMGITEETPNYAAILSSFVAAKQRELELAAENERLRASAPRAKTVKVSLPPVKQLALELIEDMSTAEDKHEENFSRLSALVLAAAKKLATNSSVEEEEVSDFTQELAHYQDAKDSIIYLLQDTFATAKAQGKVSYGRKRQANSASNTPATPVVEESEAPVF